MTDAMYMKLKQDNNGQVTAFVGPRENEIKIDVDATVKLRVWVVTAAVGYSIVDTDRVRLDVIAGARYLWVKPGLDLDISGPLQPRDKNISDSADILDGIVGIKGNVNLDKKWYVPYYADIGTGDSAFTWQGLAGVGYKISKVVDVVAAYRYLYWKFEDNKVLDKLDFSGPLVGMIFRF
jgi:opacity protein-like surface antigen